MKQFVVIAMLAVLVCGLSSSVSAEDATYIGAKKCKICHSKDKMAGTHYTVWSEKAHAKAFETLGTPEAKESAAKHGIDDPQKDERCLNCHTSKASLVDADTITHEEGVSCEACHGPASAYLKPHAKEGYEKSVELGLIPLRTMSPEELEAECLRCHKEDPLNDFHQPFNYEEYWAKIDHKKATAPQILEKRGE